MFELRPIDKRREIFGFDPFREMEELEKSFWNSDFLRPVATATGAMYSFQTDIKDLGESYQLEADMPGFKKEDIQLELDGDTLIIKAERHSEHEEKEKKGSYVRCERSYGCYQRTFDVSGVDTDEIEAEYKDGVLKLTLPKLKQQVITSRKLEIK